MFSWDCERMPRTRTLHQAGEVPSFPGTEGHLLGKLGGDPGAPASSLRLSSRISQEIGLWAGLAWDRAVPTWAPQSSAPVTELLLL
jgi:hypothetical protein